MKARCAEQGLRPLPSKQLCPHSCSGGAPELNPGRGLHLALLGSPKLGAGAGTEPGSRESPGALRGRPGPGPGLPVSPPPGRRGQARSAPPG